MGFWTVYFGIEGGGGVEATTTTYAGPLGVVTVCGLERRGKVGSHGVRFYVGPFRAISSGIGSAAIGTTFVVG